MPPDGVSKNFGRLRDGVAESSHGDRTEKETAVSTNEGEWHQKRRDDPNPQFIYVGGKDLKKLQKVAWDAGWWPKRTKSGIMWFAPNGEDHVTLHGSSSDHHAHANALGEFRKAGLDV